MSSRVSDRDFLGEIVAERQGRQISKPDRNFLPGSLHGSAVRRPRPSLPRDWCPPHVTRDPALAAPPAPRSTRLPVGAESGSVGGSAGRRDRGGPGEGWSSERVWAAAGSAMETVQLRNPPPVRGPRCLRRRGGGGKTGTGGGDPGVRAPLEGRTCAAR